MGELFSHKVPSTSSRLNFGVEPVQFHAGIVNAEVPVSPAVSGLRLVRPGGNFRLPFGECSAAAITQALTREATQLAFGDMQPTPVFRGVTELAACYVRARGPVRMLHRTRLWCAG